VIEIHALRNGEIQRSKCLQEQHEERAIKAQVMAEADGRGTTTPPTVDNPSEHNDPGTTIMDRDTPLEDALFQRQENKQPATLNNDGFIQMIKDYYPRNKLFELILEKPEDYNAFSVQEEIIWTVNPHGDEVVCVPRNRELIMQLIDQAHTVLGHYGDQQMAEYLCRWYWWP
jgi:hypothetical protein